MRDQQKCGGGGQWGEETAIISEGGEALGACSYQADARGWSRKLQGSWPRNNEITWRKSVS